MTYFDDYLGEVSKAVAELPTHRILAAAREIVTLPTAGVLHIFGNGGSAAVALHLGGHLSGLPLKSGALRVNVLSSDSSKITALSNDLGFEHVFAQQLRLEGTAGDIAIAMTTSGRSANILAALDVCRAKMIRRIVFTGTDTSNVLDGDVVFSVQAKRPPVIEDVFSIAAHMLAGVLKEDSVVDA